MTKKGKNLLIWKCHVTMTKTHAYISNEMQLPNHSLTFFPKNKSLLSATSIPSRSPMAYNTTASLDKLTCTDYVDFGKCQDRFGHFSWSKNDSNYFDVKLNLSEYESLLAKRVYLLSYIDKFLCGALHCMKHLFIIKTNSVRNGCSLSIEHFSIVPGTESVI